MLLGTQDLGKIHDAALQTGLTAQRKALLQGMDIRFAQSLDHHDQPHAQLWLDLNRLSDFPKSSDVIDEHPLAIWLMNAERLSIAYSEASVFKHYLEKLRGHLSQRTTTREGSTTGTRRMILPKPFFVGRKQELQQLREALLPEKGLPKPVAILGQGGLGKTWLGEHFMAEHQDQFRGGRHKLILNVGDQRSAAMCLAELNQALKLGAPPEQHKKAVAKALREQNILLHIDNADTAELALMIGELVGALPGAAILLTGRYTRLGEDRTSGWVRILPDVLSLSDAREQVKQELLGCRRLPSDTDIDRLVQELGRLPLAIHLAAGHIRAGRSADSFLNALRESRYQLKPVDLSTVAPEDRARQVLDASFSLSLEAFRKEAEPLVPALYALGWAPLAGFGPSLGRAITELSEFDFEELIIQAQGLALLDEMPVEEREDQAWKLHPLMANWLGLKGDKKLVQARMGAWIAERLPKNPQASRGRRWGELNQEAKGIRAWLEDGPLETLEAEWGGFWIYASSAGGVEGWIEAVERALPQVQDARKRSNLLWSLGQMARYSGMLDKAWEAVEQSIQIDHKQGWERALASDYFLQADILRERGRLDQALELLREQVLPVRRRLGEKREQASTLGRIASILQDRDQLDEALRIWRKEVLPLLKEVGDERDLGAVMGNIAVILSEQGHLDEAIEIQREEVLPVSVRLGDRLGLITDRANLADDLLERGHPEDRPEAHALLCQALAEAQRMKVAKMIDHVLGIQQKYNLPPLAPKPPR